MIKPTLATAYAKYDRDQPHWCFIAKPTEVARYKRPQIATGIVVIDHTPQIRETSPTQIVPS
jgi:hypothetical protein